MKNEPSDPSDPQTPVHLPNNPITRRRFARSTAGTVAATAFALHGTRIDVRAEESSSTSTKHIRAAGPLNPQEPALSGTQVATFQYQLWEEGADPPNVVEYDARLIRNITLKGIDERCSPVTETSKKIGWKPGYVTNRITVTAWVELQFKNLGEWADASTFNHPFDPGNFTQAHIDLAFVTYENTSNELVARKHSSYFDTTKTTAGAISHEAKGNNWGSTGNGDDNIITIDFDDEGVSGVKITVSGCSPGSPGDYEETHLAGFDEDDFTSNPNTCP